MKYWSVRKKKGQSDLVVVRRYKLPLDLTIQRWNVDAFRNVDAVCEDIDVLQWTLDP